MPELPGVLDDVRVLEIAQAVAVPVCGLLLADMGAEVIKVEPREGEALRVTLAPIFPGESKGFALFNRGKRAFCLDLAHAGASEVVERLVKGVDVVLVSLKLSDVSRYGLGHDRLAAIRPGLVYLEHAPLGPEGPNAGDGGYDVVVQGRSGVAAITGRSLGPAPAWVRPAYDDMATGFLSALAVVAAIRHRDRTGEGQKVTTSLLFTAVARGGPMLHWFAATDPPVWEKLEEDLDAMVAEAEARSASHPTDWWLAHLRSAGVPCGPFNFPHEAFRDPQINANDYLPEVEHPILGTYRTFATPFRMTKSPPRIRNSSPLYDADTDAVLEEVGYDPAVVAKLREQGVVGGSALRESAW